MSSNRPSPRRYFTVEQANAMLPLVRAIVRDLSDLSSDVIERRDRLNQLKAGRNLNLPTSIAKNLRKSSRKLKKIAFDCASMWKNL